MYAVQTILKAGHKSQYIGRLLYMTLYHLNTIFLQTKRVYFTVIKFKCV